MKTSSLVKSAMLQTISSENGIVTVAEAGKDFDFEAKRVFAVSGTPAGARRGGHAHKATRQLLICVSGVIEIEATDGKTRSTEVLDAVGKCLHVPAGIWCDLRYAAPQSILMVVCDTLFDESDYIRDYEAFLRYRSD